MKRIFVAEEVPGGNKGEVAIIKGIEECFKGIGISCKISVLSPFYPEIDFHEYSRDFKVIDGVASLHIPHGLTERSYLVKILASIWCLIQHIMFILLYKIFGRKTLTIMKGEIWREYLDTDLLLVGHDNLFANPYGSALAFLNSYILLLAKMINKPCVVFGASVGPFNNKIFLLFIKFILNHADAITLRDKKSYEFVKFLGIDKPPVSLCLDPAVLLKPASFEQIDRILIKERINVDRGLIGIMAGPVMYKRLSLKVDIKTKYEYHISNIAYAIDYMISKLDVNVLLMYHATFPAVNDDRLVITDIYKKVSNKDQVKLIVNNYSADEIKGLIGLCELFIGDRTHSLIASATMCVPCISISHKNNYKTNGLIGDFFGLNEGIVFIEDFDKDKFVKLIDYQWNIRNENKKKLLGLENRWKTAALKNAESAAPFFGDSSSNLKG